MDTDTHVNDQLHCEKTTVKSKTNLPRQNFAETDYARFVQW